MRSSTIILAAATTSVLVTFALGLVYGTDATFGRWAPVDGVPRPAPAFVLRNLAGGPLRSSELRGKIIILDFWATWCGPCLEEIDDYNELRAAYAGSGVDVLGVTMQSGTAAEVAAFATQWSVEYPLFLGDDDTLQRFGPLWGYPTTFLIDRVGAVRGVWVGAGAGKIRQIRGVIEEILSTEAVANVLPSQ